MNVGDRVCIPAEKADDYIQPWKARIKRKSGLCGTVTMVDGGLMTVQWDVPARAKYPPEWEWRRVTPREVKRIAPSPVVVPDNG